MKDVKEDKRLKIVNTVETVNTLNSKQGKQNINDDTDTILILIIIHVYTKFNCHFKQHNNTFAPILFLKSYQNIQLYINISSPRLLNFVQCPYIYRAVYDTFNIKAKAFQH